MDLFFHDSRFNQLSQLTKQLMVPILLDYIQLPTRYLGLLANRHLQLDTSKTTFVFPSKSVLLICCPTRNLGIVLASSLFPSRTSSFSKALVKAPSEILKSPLALSLSLLPRF